MRKRISRGMAIVMLLAALLTPWNGAGVFAETRQTLCINEVMASNESVIRDGDVDDPKYGSQGGAYSDWIEIYNPGDEPVSLKGYILADSGATWVFPEGMVPAKGYLIVWASDKDKVAKDGQLHTNFKISSSGETLTLKDPDGNVIDMVDVVSLKDDQSYGRLTDGSSSFAVFSRSTPGSANILGEAVVAEPVFSKKAGFYTQEFQLEISTTDPATKIYYTTDGSDPVPGKEGTYEYNGAITVKSREGEPNYYSELAKEITRYLLDGPQGEVFKCTVIRAVAVDANGNTSKIVTNSYFVDPNMMTRYDLPVISLVTDPKNLFDIETGLFSAKAEFGTGKEWERPMHIEFFENNGALGFSQNGGMRLHGGAISKGLDQRALRLYADNGYDDVNRFEYNIFPGLKDKNGKDITSFQRLILRNSGSDWLGTMFKDSVLQKMVSHLNGDIQAYRPSVVFIDGEFWGMYNIRERYDTRYYASHYNLDRKKVAILEINLEEIELNEGTEEDLIAYIRDIDEYLQNNSVESQSAYDYIKTKMDIENFIDYQISNIYFGNTDWLKRNVTMWRYRTDDGLYHPEAPYGQDGRWRWSVKDVEHSFGVTAASHDTLDYAISIKRVTPILKKLLENSEFKTQFVTRFTDLLNTTFEPTRVNQMIDEAKNLIASTIEEHDRRWGISREWDNEINIMKEFAVQRPDYMRRYIQKNIGSLGITGTSEITLNTDIKKGYIRINTIDINTSTPGVTNPEKWTGVYFTGVPVTIKAVADKGYVFDRWEGVGEEEKNKDTITFIPTEDMNITAVFKPDGSDVDPTPTPVIKYGDVNDDGEIDSLDVTILKRYILKKYSDINKEAADLDLDSDINSYDLTLLKKYLLKKIPYLPYY